MATQPAEAEPALSPRGKPRPGRPISIAASPLKREGLRIKPEWGLEIHCVEGTHPDGKPRYIYYYYLTDPDQHED